MFVPMSLRLIRLLPVCGPEDIDACNLVGRDDVAGADGIGTGRLLDQHARAVAKRARARRCSCRCRWTDQIAHGSRTRDIDACNLVGRDDVAGADCIRCAPRWINTPVPLPTRLELGAVRADIITADQIAIRLNAGESRREQPGCPESHWLTTDKGTANRISEGTVDDQHASTVTDRDVEGTRQNRANQIAQHQVR